MILLIGIILCFGGIEYGNAGLYINPRSDVSIFKKQDFVGDYWSTSSRNPLAEIRFFGDESIDDMDMLPWRTHSLTMEKCKKIVLRKCMGATNFYEMLLCLWQKWFCEGVLSNGYCLYKGKQYMHGKYITKGCNKCKCIVPLKGKIGIFSCTKKVCPTGFCRYNGRKFAHGKTIKVKCNTCTCRAPYPKKIGIFTCTKRACHKVVVTKPILPAVHKGFCLYNGKRILYGVAFKIKCNTCVCRAHAGSKVGIVSCTKMGCIKVKTLKPKTALTKGKKGVTKGKAVVVKGKTTKVTKGKGVVTKGKKIAIKKKIIIYKPKIAVITATTAFCIVKGKKYVPGHYWMKGCNKCHCIVFHKARYGSVLCTAKPCTAGIKPVVVAKALKKTALIHGIKSTKLQKKTAIPAKLVIPVGKRTQKKAVLPSMKKKIIIPAGRITHKKAAIPILRKKLSIPVVKGVHKKAALPALRKKIIVPAVKGAQKKAAIPTTKKKAIVTAKKGKKAVAHVIKKKVIAVPVTKKKEVKILNCTTVKEIQSCYDLAFGRLFKCLWEKWYCKDKRITTV